MVEVGDTPTGPRAPSLRSAAFAWALLVMLLAGCATTVTGSPTATVSPTALPNTIALDPTNPYYIAAQALSQPQVQAGAKVGSCTINAFTHCPGADLSTQYLQGAFLAYSDLNHANLAGVNLLQADVAFANLSGANLSGAKLSGTSTTKATFEIGRASCRERV